jgi:predicted DNA-binding transcriptional regulator YafY
MSKSADRVFRLLELLRQIQNSKATAQTLADSLEVSLRTVRRDIQLLRDSGIPINFNYEDNRFDLEGSYLLPSMEFTPEEAMTLLVLCTEMGGDQQLPFFEPARNAALKLASGLPPDLSEQVQAAHSAMSIRIPAANPLDEQDKIFSQLIESHRERRAIRIAYKSPAEPDEISTLLHPYKLLYSMRSWYVIGRSSLHREPRTFNISRIHKIELLDQTYAIPRNFRLSKYLGNAWRLIPEPGPDSEVLIRFDAKVAQNVSEVRWHPTQRVLFNSDGSIDFHATVSGLNEISWWVLGYGKHAKVLQPEGLRNLVASQIREMSSLYDDVE